MAILKIGVIPLPAANAATVLVWFALGSKIKRPLGSATSIVCPDFNALFAWIENFPPSTAFIPTVNAPLFLEEQME